MGSVVAKHPCPSCRDKGNDRSGDNLVEFEDGGKTCFACGHVIYSKDWRYKRKEEVEETLMERTSDKLITKEENQELKSKTGVCNYRGVRADTWKRLGVRFVFDQETGTPIRQYYPNTLDGKLSGYKRRDLPKKFGAPLGETGAVCDLYGSGPAFRKPNQKQLIIVGGEVDQASVSQVLYDYTKKRGYKHPNMLVVSPSVGESCKKQIKYNHKMLAEYDEVFIGFDMDDAGKKATEDVVKVLPRVKVRIIEWTKKDPNEMLQAGLDGEIISCIYNAKVHTSTSIAGSSTLMSSLAEEIQKVMIPLPPFMKKLSELMCGGMPLGSIINIGAMSGIGKTSIVNEIVYYLLFNSPYKVGILSMELNSGQYAEVLLSRHIGRKIALIGNTDDKINFINEPDVKEAAQELFTEDGADRFFLMDERDGSIKDVMKLVEEMIINCDCKVIVLDPLQDILDGLSNEEQAVFLKWQKTMVGKYNTTFINISHLRKNNNPIQPEDTGLDILYNINEQDFQGTSAIFKSGSANILFARNKRNEDPIEKNTTYVMLDKCRWSGYSGFAGDWFYELETHTMHDKQEYMEGKR